MPPIPPRKLSLNLTDTCNLNCKHCYRKNPQPPATLNWSQIKSALSYFLTQKYQNCDFTGGEPLLSPHLERAVNYARQIGYRKIEIHTNGTFPKVLKTFTPQQIDHLVFSLDGANSRTHDFLRGTGNFNLCLNTLKRAVKAGFNCSVTFTVNSQNKNEGEKIAKLLDKIKVNNLYFNFTSFMGNARFHQDLLISPKQWKSFTKNLKKIKGLQHLSLHFPWRFTTPKQYQQIAKNQKLCLLEQSTRTQISATGHFYHCCLLEEETRFSTGKIDQTGKITPLKPAPLPLGHLKFSCPAQIYLQKKDQVPNLSSPQLIPICLYYKETISPSAPPNQKTTS